MRVGIDPVSIQYADSNQEVYVANTGDGTLSVISSATEKVITTIDTSCNLYYQYHIEYNPANQEIYEPCTGGNVNGVLWNLVAISTSTNTVAARVYSGSGGPGLDLVYAGSNNDIYYLSCCQVVFSTQYNIDTPSSPANNSSKPAQVGNHFHYFFFYART